MHLASLLRMKWFAENYVDRIATNGQVLKILDVGNYDLNGSYKSFFGAPSYEYVGLDISWGPNVDLVPNISLGRAQIPRRLLAILSGWHGCLKQIYSP